MDAITKILPLVGIGTAGAGLVGNIMNSIQRGKVASQAEKNASLTPGQLGSMVSSATQPLDRSLIEMVQNSVQGDMASRGLAEAPGIFAASESQALAPFEQQNQNTALQLILKQLGLPEETLAALSSGGGGSANMLPLLMMLMQGKKPTATGTTSPLPPPTPTPTDPGLSTGGDWGGGGLDTTGLGV
jgi:hypothetical protein